MSDAHEGHGKHESKHEGAPHAGHGDAHGKEAAHGADAHGGGHGGPAKWIGITMAVLGVMLAVCAALVGSARTELLAASIEQANKFGIQQSEATKFRVMDADRELLHAVTPSKTETAKFENALKDVRSRSGKADDEDTAEIKDLLDTATRSMADVLTPDPEDEARIGGLRKTYARDLAEAKEDAEAYDGAIEAHAEEAEGYEKAQLCAEIGIVVASIALLLSSRLVWFVALAVGIGGFGIGVKTRMETSAALVVAEKKIEDAKNNAAVIEDEDNAGGEATPGKPDKVGEKPPAKPNE